MAGEDVRVKGNATDNLTSKVLDAVNAPGGLSVGSLLNIVNENLPADMKVEVKAKEDTSTRNVTAPLSKVYTPFDYSKDVIISEQIVTEGVFPGGVGIIQNKQFYTSSLQNISSSVYYITVTDAPTTSSNALFDVAYASLSSSLSESQAIYRQLKNILLPANDEFFTFNTGIDVHSLIVVALKRARYGERLDVGNWMLKVYSGSTTMSFVDDSTVTDSTQTAVGERVSIVSGTIGSIYDTNTKWGYCYPDLGLLLFDGKMFAQSCSYSSSLDFVNHLDYFQARNEYRLKDVNYFVRVYNKDYNYSNNPTFYTSSTGEYIHQEFSKDPHVFITTIGLYNDNNELLAIARLSKPVEKTFEREAVFRCRLSF